MKNQYFGDINDYAKYGLIRALHAEARLRVLVAWMLTRDERNDGLRDGELRSYLDEPDRWQRFDPELYRGLRNLLETNASRRVALIEQSPLLGPARYFSDIVPDDADHRGAWAKKLERASSRSELVFLDPDTGLEVPSQPYGRKGSSKYLYWREVQQIWRTGASVLIYQHFPHEKRTTFISRIAKELRKKTSSSLVEAFSTPRVLFLLASQREHARDLQRAIGRAAERWKPQISLVGLPSARRG